VKELAPGGHGRPRLAFQASQSNGPSGRGAGIVPPIVRSSLITFLLALVMLAGCASSWRDAATRDVYVALIDHAARKNGEARTVAVARRTLECQHVSFDRSLSEEWMPAVADLKKRCSESRAVADAFRTPHRTRFIEAARYAARRSS
jgi:hypothetical protein